MDDKRINAKVIVKRPNKLESVKDLNCTTLADWKDDFMRVFGYWPNDDALVSYTDF